MANATASRLGVVNGATPTNFATENGFEAVAAEGSPLADLVATLPDFNDDDSDLSEMKLN